MVFQVKAGKMRMIKYGIVLSLLCFLLPVSVYSIDSIEKGIKYRVPKEMSIFPGWKHITFLNNNTYRLESETIIYEGTMVNEPDQEGWSLQSEFAGRVWKIEDPVNEDIFVMNGDKTNSITILFMGVIRPIRTWSEFATYANINYKLYILERAKK